MASGQEKSLDKERIAKGMSFIKAYQPPSEYQQLMTRFQRDLAVCKDRLIQLGSDGDPKRIEQAQGEKKRLEFQREIEYCKVALKDDLSPEHRLGVQEYLEELRADLKKAGGVEL